MDKLVGGGEVRWIVMRLGEKESIQMSRNRPKATIVSYNLVENVNGEDKIYLGNRTGTMLI